MPVLKHAKKKLRQDKKRTRDNLHIKERYKKMIKKAKANPTAEAVNAAFSSIDKAAKKQVIHKNKAARLKSSLAKAVKNTTATGEKTKTVKTITTAKKKTTRKTSKKSAKK